MKKQLFHTVMNNRNKSGILKNLLTLITGCAAMLGTHAQVVGNWNFNNTVSGTGTTTNTAGTATLVNSTGAFNGGTVYYGEGGWPSGALDPATYLEFSLTPNSGHTLSLSYIALNIRRSTTGTAAGSGPQTWSLRSNIDGYSSDIATGTLTLVSTSTVNVTFPSSGYTNLSSKIVFRLYGYNSVVTTGGLNRFVFDNITVNGSSTLPVTITGFNASAVNNTAAQLSWTVSGDESTMSMEVQRSSNGNDFSTIKNIVPANNGSATDYSFVDESMASASGAYYYRIAVTTDAGHIYYSQVQQVSFAAATDFNITALPTRHGGNVQVMVKTDKTDGYHFYLYNMNGTKLAVKNMSLGAGSQLVSMDNMPLTSGLYIIVGEHTGNKTTAKIWVE